MLVLAGAAWEWRRAHTEVVLTVLPLNGGHAVFVDAPGRNNDWLVDCGETNAVQFITKPFLHAQGVNRLARLALTHGDLQHVGGTHLLWDDFQVAHTDTSPIRFRSAMYRDLMSALDAVPERHGIIARGDTAGCWSVLHPGADDKFPQADDSSLVLLGQFHGTRILLLGDLGRPGQEALMKRGADLRADIVVTGLPEQTEPLCNGLIEAVQPKLIIVADSEFPATKRAGRGLRERLDAAHVPVIYTRTDGAVTLTIQPTRWIMRTMNVSDFPEHQR